MFHPLQALFSPNTLAVIGASERYGSTGRNVFSQLLAHCCAPHIVPINPNHKTICGQKSYESLSQASNEMHIDTVIIVLSTDKISSILREMAKLNIHYAIIINDLDTPNHNTRNKLDRISEQATKAHIKLLAVPSRGLYEWFKQPTHPACAYIGQALGITDCMQSYATERDIKFSRFLTLNPQNYPISTGQIIDYVAADKNTNALLVHINVLDNPRELLSALTAAARQKPVVLLSTLSDNEQDTLFTQALERAHILTAHSLTQLFTAAKLIHTGISSHGKNIAFVSNTPQICALTLKNIHQAELQLAQISSITTRTLGKILPQKPLNSNPLNLPSDSSAGVFQTACESILADDNTDAVCLIFAGQNSNDNTQIAQTIARLQQHTHKPLLLVWLGSADNQGTRKIFNQYKNLHFKQPEHALHALTQLNLYRQHQQQRYRTHAFHDYRYATVAAEELRKHLRPLLPVAVLPASKNNTSIFLTGLQVFHDPDNPPKSGSGMLLIWEKQEPFGYVLTLIARKHKIKLLPPITPEIAARGLNQLGLPAIIWQDWILTSIDILCRLPEIHTVQLTLHHDANKGIVCSDIKLNLQEPDNKPNIFTPYAYDAERAIALKNGENAWLRPVRPEDASLIQRLANEMSEKSRYMRFMSKSPTLSPALLSRLSQPDYQREFAILLYDEEHNPLAHASYTADPNGISCEFGISIADRLHGQGIGSLLMQTLITRAKAQGFHQIRAEILSENQSMQKLALKLGFSLTQHPNDTSLVEARLSLT